MKTSTLLRSLAIVTVVAAAPALADQIVELYGTSLTSYLYSGTTAVQGVRPLVTQRGVFIDGTMRQPSAFGWALAGDPLNAGGANSWNANRRMGAMDLANGAFSPTYVQMALPAPEGGRWIVGISYNGIQDNGGHLNNTGGYQGANWMQDSQPELRYFAGVTGDLDVIYLVYGADRFIEFQRSGVSSTYFKAKNGAAGVISFGLGYTDVGTGHVYPDTYAYTDQRGNTATFFGSAGSGAGAAAWQLWKLTGESGNTAYVGDTDAYAALSAGYDAGGRIQVAYDAADNNGRRYTYAYSTHDGVVRLDQVKAEVKTGGTWASPSGTSTVGTVDYTYYTGGNANGDDGCLKLVTVTTPLSPGSTNLVEKTYFRYYVGAYNGSTNRGNPYTLMLVVGPEGYRNYDWAQDSVLNDDTPGASTANLKSYSDAYLEYASNYKIDTAFFNGECGCGGGGAINGTYAFTYDDSSSKSTYVGNTQYDAGWATRTVIKQPAYDPTPKNAYITQYFDEAGGPITRVITDGDPASVSPPSRWVTEVVRSAWDGTNHLGGAITEVRTPRANTAYTHNTTGSPTGTWTASSSVGLITTFTRPTSGDMRGMVTERFHKKGTSGTAYYDADYVYGSATQTIGSLVLTRPTIDTSNGYTVETASLHDSGKYVSTTWSRTFWTLVEKNVTQTNPVVSTGNNGANSATTQSMYFNADGTLAFTKSPNGIIGYRAYDTKGLLAMSIQDTNTASGDLSGVTIPSSPVNYATSGAYLHLKTTMVYDPQGRRDETTLPDSRVTKTSYTKIKDGRRVVLSTPKYVSGSTTSYSPASYTVSNLAGGAQFSATVAFSAGTTTTAMTSWVSTTSGADPIASLGTGTITRLMTSLHSDDGHKVTESRQYSVVPGSGAGSAGTNYDATLYGYDNMGRKTRTVDPTGTINRTVVDALGRTLQMWTGLNDNSFGALTGGSSDMTQTMSQEWDGGGANKNSELTTRTIDPDGLWVNDGSPGNPDDRRITLYYYDSRDRLVFQANPDVPYTCIKLDNLGRAIATGRYSTLFPIMSGTGDPTADVNDRMDLSETVYDEMGRVCKTIRHKIDITDGSDDDHIDRLSWFDPEGRLMKQLGDGTHTKMQYDRVGKQIGTYMLVTDDDTTYADASASTGIWDSTNTITRIAGDKVLEETHTVYENSSGNVLFRTSVQRNVGDTSTTGTLDSGADVDPTTVTDTDIKGRIQITAMWYDSLDRMVDTANYGTNGIVGDGSTTGGTFTRGGSAPTRSGSALRTTTTYDDDGSMLQVEGPGIPGDLSTTTGIKTRYAYDAAGRTLKVIHNYVNGVPGDTAADDDQTVIYTYTNGLRTAITADLPSPASDQVTTYIYGTTKGTPATMAVSTGNRLRAVKYPDSTNAGTNQAYIDGTSDADVVSYAYDTTGARVYAKDQNGSVVETTYDILGRDIQRSVTTLGSGVDGAVRRIVSTYTPRGQVLKVSQYDNATSGTLLDDVKYTYDDWGNVLTFAQDPDSDLDLSPSGVPSFTVSYTYTKASPSGASTRVRKTAASYAGASLTYEYSNSSSLDDAASRVTDVKISTTVVAIYSYLGAGQVVYTTLDETATRLQAGWSGSVYQLDAFNRVTKSAAHGKSGNNIYDVDLAYDWDSNIIGATDNLRKNGSDRVFDAIYGLDNLSRLISTQEGQASGGAISTNKHTRYESWTLNQAGDWSNHKLDLTGGNTPNYSDAGEFQEDGTFNTVNELTQRDIDTNNTAGYETTYASIGYDGNGNLTDDKKDYKYVWDGFNRLKQVKNQSSALVAEYRYNGLNFRISWKYDNDRSGGGAPDGTVDGNDHTYYFGFDERWRILTTSRDSDSDPKERFVYHNAGLGGMGGSSYIDDMVLRDRDANTAWRSSADGVLEERRYDCQNWRHDVSAVITDTGKIVESVKYTSYGVAFGIPAGDTNSSGTWDATDAAALGVGTTTDPSLDPDQSGTSDASDATWANSITGSYQTLGRGVQSSSAVANRKGYAGYELDPTFTGAGRNLSHVRNRVFDADLGRWLGRDRAGYRDSVDLYQYVRGMPVVDVDWSGLEAHACSNAGSSAINVGDCALQNSADISACEDCCRCSFHDNVTLLNICYTGCGLLVRRYSCPTYPDPVCDCRAQADSHIFVICESCDTIAATFAKCCKDMRGNEVLCNAAADDWKQKCHVLHCPQRIISDMPR